ncbi:DUF3105 domain containing protein-like protein [Dinothrombium tinctorium]|uniref:DUF3105 domain containing protein-like protein n=1 Tax=Dinothrombium tinctorium TaxID=1965070 RepID=A0A443REM4_9ACAR|nr:DUF3105 domain containing protein-like protein [Dinothrombium tinctorium]
MSTTSICFALILVFFCVIGAFSSLDNSDSRNEISEAMKDAKHGVKMGEVFDGCDDAESNLDVDWDGSCLDFTCYHPKQPFRIRSDLESVESCVQLPKDYSPQHFCMGQKITYNTTIPTYGDHRPLWPVFGEYEYVPPQRWLHNIEHGSVVMLYHPCAHPCMVDRLRKIVVNCIRKHVITPNVNLPKDRPLALVTWGCKLQMSYVNHENHEKVVSFIRRTALKGPEGTYAKEGQFMKGLLVPASIPKGSDRMPMLLY